MDGTIRVTFLGSGNAFSAGGRHQAAYLVKGGGTSLLLDCGATTLASLKSNTIDTADIDTVFISHLHGDHFCGLPFLLLEYVYERPRQRSLRVAGPPGTRERVWDLFRAAYRDTSQHPLPFPLEFTELYPETVVQLGPVVVEPFRVPHQETEISLGLRVILEGQRLLYSGDTGWTEELVRRSEDTDLFICECCFYETRLPFHLDYPRIEENRTRFGTKRLILTHLGQEVLRRRNQLEIELASDGLTVDLP